MRNVRRNINLEELNEDIHKIFNIEKVEYIRSQDKITGVKFNLNQSNKDLNYAIIELLNLYIVPAFVLPNSQKNKDVSVRIGNRQETFIVEKYIRNSDIYIESKEKQKGNRKLLDKAKNFVQNLISGEEEIEFIEINKDNLNFQISSNESTEVEITFAESEINMRHMEGILNCTSNFKKLTNNDVIKSLIEIDYNQPVVKSQDKLNIYPFFAKKTIGDNKDNIKQQETILCLTTKQNDVELVSSIFRDNASQFKIKCKEGEYSLLSYSLDNPFSQNLIDFLLFFNDPSCNGDTKISNLQRIEKIFSEDIEIKNGQEDKKENGSNKAKIRIENATCFTSSLYYEDGHLQLKKSVSEEKVYFNFEVRVESDLDQKESQLIYDSTIYKIASLISFFALCFNENKFSISAEVDKENIFSLKTSSYSELVPTICEKLKKHAIPLIKPEDYANPKPQHVQVLDLFCTKKVKFKLEAEAQKIAIDRLKDVEGLISGISILDSCRKEFLDNISNPVRCYLSNFFYDKDNPSCVYVIAHKDLKINNHLLDENSEIDFLKNQFLKSFSRISGNLKQIGNLIKTKEGKELLFCSIDINVDKLLSHNKPQEEEVKAEPQKYIEYDVDWQEECFVKITPANDYTSLKLGLKKACEFVHRRVQHVCKQLLEKINTLQCGREQKVEQDDQLSDESIIQATLDDNISNFNEFRDEKVREFQIIKPNLDSEQEKIIVNIGKSISYAIQRYEEVVKIYLFINKNANDLSKLLEKHVEELEQLMLDIQMSKNNQIVGEIGKSLAEQDAGLSNTKNGNIQENINLSLTNSGEQTDCIEENEKVENKVTLGHILELFKELSSKLKEWKELNQGTTSGESRDASILFHHLKSQIKQCIEINQKQEEKALYEKIYQKIHYIYYSCIELAELEIRKIEGVTRSYLLDEQEEELKRREVQLEQMTSVKEAGSDIIISAAQSVISLYKKTKDKVINLKNQLQSPNVHNTEYPSNSSYNNTYNDDNQPPNYRQHNAVCNLEVTSQSNNFTIDNTYNHKRSNLQKLSAGIKDAFSEKENYAFLVFIAVGTSGTLAYFVPEGLRKFVPSEKLNIIDITVAIGATVLIALSVAALTYSVHSNVTNPTASSHNARSLNP
ncbi:hypothetical protein [Candidatus Mesenet endosymbiont of Agriotes lineatus]|uniref:hypothetical protein n=1 Tax=Candidatus Mesenet endosymbiont of Agriotes lineatus TaxID=3077948 RepID=UPI0030D05F9E